MRMAADGIDRGLSNERGFCFDLRGHPLQCLSSCRSRSGSRSRCRCIHVRYALELERRLCSSTNSLAFQQPDAGAFEMAFVLLALLLVPDSGCVQAAEAVALRLLAQQNADGSWPSAPILRIPPPLTADPGRLSKWPSGTGTGVIIADQRRCFTRAAVLSALAACQGCTRLSESP